MQSPDRPCDASEGGDIPSMCTLGRISNLAESPLHRQVRVSAGVESRRFAVVALDPCKAYEIMPIQPLLSCISQRCYPPTPSVLGAGCGAVLMALQPGWGQAAIPPPPKPDTLIQSKRDICTR